MRAELNGNGNGTTNGTNGHSNGYGRLGYMSESPARSGPTIDDYWMALYRRKWIIFIVAIAAAVGCYFVSQRVPQQYEARAVFYVPSDSSGTLGLDTSLAARLPSGEQDHAKAFAEIIDQPAAWAAVRDMPLHSTTFGAVGVYGRFRSGDVTYQKRSDVTAVAEEARTEATFAETDIVDVLPTKPMGRFASDIDIVAGRESTIEVYVRDRDADQAAGIANAMVAYFNEFQQKILVGGIEDSIEQVQRALVEKDAEIQDALVQQGEFLAENQIASLPTQQSEYERVRISLRRELHDARAEREGMEDRLAVLEARLAEEEASYRAGDIVVESAALTNLQRRVADLEIDLAGRRVEFTSEHPEVIALEQQVAQARERLHEETQRLVGSHAKSDSLHSELRRKIALLQADRAGIEPRVTGLASAILEIEDDIMAIPAKVTTSAMQDETLAQLRGMRQDMQATLTTLLTRSLELRDTALVIQTAEPPSHPSYPIVFLNVIVAAVLGLIVGVLYALIIEHTQERRRIRKLRNYEIERWFEALPPAEKREKVTV